MQTVQIVAGSHAQPANAAEIRANQLSQAVSLRNSMQQHNYSLGTILPEHKQLDLQSYKGSEDIIGKIKKPSRQHLRYNAYSIMSSVANLPESLPSSGQSVSRNQPKSVNDFRTVNQQNFKWI